MLQRFKQVSVRECEYDHGLRLLGIKPVAKDLNGFTRRRQASQTTEDPVGDRQYFSGSGFGSPCSSVFPTADRHFHQNMLRRLFEPPDKLINESDVDRLIGPNGAIGVHFAFYHHLQPSVSPPVLPSQPMPEATMCIDKAQLRT